MQITVKSVKVLKEGNRKDGAAYKMIGVVAEDGRQYATFHAGAINLKPGTVIMLDKVEVKTGKDNQEQWSFKEYEIVSAPEPEKTHTGNPVNGMTPADWEKKDRLERESREANTCFMGVTELLTAKIILPDGELATAALDWALRHFKTSASTQKPATSESRTTTTVEEEFEKLGRGSIEFKNAGDFLTRVTKELGFSRSDIAERLSINDVKEVTDFTKAWAQLTAKDPTQKQDGAQGTDVHPEGLPF